MPCFHESMICRWGRALRWGLVAVSLVWVAGCSTHLAGGPSDMPRPSHPNILWIFSEDLSPFMGCYGDPVNAGHTPAIDQLAAEGVLFKRAFVSAPVCSASRSALITGVMQTTTGTHHHRSGRTTDGEVVPEALRIRLPEGMRTIPELMRDAGYFTFNSGKDDYNFHYDRRALYSVGTDPDYAAGMNGWQGNRARHARSWTRDVWGSRNRPDQPWFGQIMLMGGKDRAKHVRAGAKLAPDALVPPAYFPDTAIQRASWTEHYNAVRGADTQVQAILAQLARDGELENTVVFFFSDHGSNQSLRHKQFCYEGGVHVPLVVWGDHPWISRGVVRDELVPALDISATTLALGGADLPAYLDGQNLFASDYRPQSYVVSARDRCDYTIDRIRTVRSDRFRYLRNFFPDRPMLQAQYRDREKDVVELRRLHDAGALSAYQSAHWFGPRPEEELYLLESDPHQMNNLADDPAHAQVLAEHRGVLNRWMADTEDRGGRAEDRAQLRATYELWKDRPVFRDARGNAEYGAFKNKPSRALGPRSGP